MSFGQLSTVGRDSSGEPEVAAELAKPQAGFGRRRPDNGRGRDPSTMAARTSPRARALFGFYSARNPTPTSLMVQPFEHLH